MCSAYVVRYANELRMEDIKGTNKTLNRNCALNSITNGSEIYLKKNLNKVLQRRKFQIQL